MKKRRLNEMRSLAKSLKEKTNPTHATAWGKAMEAAKQLKVYGDHIPNHVADARDEPEEPHFLKHLQGTIDGIERTCALMRKVLSEIK